VKVGRVSLTGISSREDLVAFIFNRDRTIADSPQITGAMAEAYAPLDHTDLTEQTYEVLKNRILTRQVVPGEKISVEEVAHGLGVSRTPVTDALKRLASDGLVEIMPRRGTFVSEVTTRDVAEMFDIRLLIETHAAEMILQNGKIESFLHSIEEPTRVMSRATVDDDYGDYEAFIEGDRQMHLALVKATDNHKLLEMYTDLNVHMHVARAHYLRSVENARQAHQEHEAILAAFHEGDPEKVKRELGRHITNVKTRILELLEERGGHL
jgi:DNA-binding GntR family transcriptional regulator